MADCFYAQGHLILSEPVKLANGAAHKRTVDSNLLTHPHHDRARVENLRVGDEKLGVAWRAACVVMRVGMGAGGR